jgi:hypothetical protein
MPGYDRSASRRTAGASLALCGALFAAQGCTVIEPQTDGGVADAGYLDAGGLDAGLQDAGLLDAGFSDAGSRDAGRQDAGVVADGGIAPDAGAGGPCSAMAIGPKSLSGYSTDLIQWSDEACRPRSAALVRNDAADPGGSHGGFLRELVYEVDGKKRVCSAQAGTDWNGWGYVVDHYSSTAATSRGSSGTYRTILAGPHHAVHEFKTQTTPGGPVDVTIQWIFATGKSHPLYAITFDASRNAANALKADTRAPYGNLNFDGLADGPVAGLGWGDKYKFTTTGAGPVTMATGWEYTASNSIPYVVMWASQADAEMGAVETRPFDKTISGGDYGGGMLSDCWGHTSASPGDCAKDDASDSMFASWLWPYQLNQYELPFATTSKRLAWGANYAAVGQSSYNSLGRTGLSGYPRVSYAVHVVLGKHSEQAVAQIVAEMEATQRTVVTASVGQVAQSGAAGPGRSDTTTFSPLGWNPLTGTWDLLAQANAVAVHFTPGGALSNPVFRVRDFTGSDPKLRLDGASLVSGVDYFATLDSSSSTLWITLKRKVTTAIDLSLE